MEHQDHPDSLTDFIRSCEMPEDEEPLKPGQQQQQQQQPMPNGTAPIIKMERVLVGRPLKVMALMLNILNVLLLMISTSSSSWIVSMRGRSGLWEECSARNGGNITDMNQFVCSHNPTNTGYSMACALLMLNATVISVIAVLLFTYGMMTKNVPTKSVIYSFTHGIHAFIGVTTIAALVVYPLRHMREIAEQRAPQAGGESQWDIGWAYIVGWVSIVVLLCSSLLLFIDKSSEELVYRERILQPHDGEDGEGDGDA